MDRVALHKLIDRIPDDELPVAQRFLEYLAVSPAYRAALTAQPDNEPVTPEDADAIALAEADLRDGKVVSHEDVLREFGMR